jgi:kinesin family protein 6/9
MMNVINEASVNIQLDTNALLKKYVKEIKELKQELAMHNTLANKRINYDPYTPEESYQQQLIAKKFLHGTDDIEFESVRQAKELFNNCRQLYRRLLASNPDVANENVKVVGKHSTHNAANLLKKQTYEDDGQGILEIKPSFGLGNASKDARPINKCNYYFNFSGNFEREH